MSELDWQMAMIVRLDCASMWVLRLLLDWNYWNIYDPRRLP